MTFILLCESVDIFGLLFSVVLCLHQKLLHCPENIQGSYKRPLIVDFTIGRLLHVGHFMFKSVVSKSVSNECAKITFVVSFFLLLFTFYVHITTYTF